MLLLALVAFGWWWIHRSIPPLSGRVTVPGLRAAVDVRFDRYAVPHVFAQSDEDAWRSVGFLQARDRLWQMELYRRAASGRLSEILGEATVAIDQRFLTLGLRQAAEMEWSRLTPRARAAFESYAAGVNAAMSVPAGQMPLEFQLLGLRPDPWTPVDSLAIGKLFAWRLGENHRAELLRYALVQALGPRALELFPDPPEWAPVILADADGVKSKAPAAAAALRVVTPGPRADVKAMPRDRVYPPGLEWLSPEHHAMSNSWVVHGSRTATGKPLLANDPHLALEMPSVWWEVHVASATLNVAGVTIPGIPFVIIGHNARVAWGVTNVGADVQDFFVERLDESRTKFRAGSEWRPLEVRHHRIRVSGRDEPIAFDVRSTPHGPVMNADEWREAFPGDAAMPNALNDTVLALKWDAVSEGQSAVAFDAIARAANWTDFVAAVRQFSAPAQNFVYADVDGNIGYAMSGLVPLRPGSTGSVPQSGIDAESGPAATVDMNTLPAVLNPPAGEIVTANNEVDRGLPYRITGDWVAPFRAQRIGALLKGRDGLSVEAMAGIQADITSLSADWILKNVELPPDVDELRQWDRRVDQRPVSILYEAFEEALWRRTFADEMPVDLFEQFYRYAGNERFAGLHAIIDKAGSAWFDDRRTSDVVETREQIVRQAAADAVAARQRLANGGGGRWDEIHAAKFTHPLAGGGRVLDWFFSRGPVPLAGDSMTVNKTTTDLREPYRTSEAASYRQILDVGAWDRSVAVNTTGQSGHPRSPHYFDQNSLWRQAQYRSLAFTRAAVDAATVSRLELAGE